MPTGLRRPRVLSSLFAVLTILGSTGCDGGTLPLSVDLDRETFVATYVDLRLAALDSPGGILPDVQRDAILADHDVTQDQLLEFAEVRGRDAAYMTDVWNEVAARMDGDPVDASADTDTTG